MGRDVLAVDVLLADGNPPSGGDGEGGDGALNANEEGKKRSCIRIATTHLESLGEEPGFEVRPLQLALIARLLKERPSETEEGEGRSDVEIVGGLVGGDMNAISEVDFTSHKRADVELRDAWEEAIGAETVRGGEESEDGSKEEEDANVGSAEGHTWGYQNRSKWPPRRLDKFFVTGGVQVVKLEETKGDCSGNIGRVGVGMKIESGLWISDHFGIAVGIKVL